MTGAEEKNRLHDAMRWCKATMGRISPLPRLLRSASDLSPPGQPRTQFISFVVESTDVIKQPGGRPKGSNGFFIGAMATVSANQIALLCPYADGERKTLVTVTKRKATSIESLLSREVQERSR